MMQHDLGCWPLVLSFSSGQPTLQELHDYSGAWTNWLAHGERFAVLQVLQDSAPTAIRRAGRKSAKAGL